MPVPGRTRAILRPDALLVGVPGQRGRNLASGRHLFVTSNDTTVHVFDTLTWARARRLTWNVGRLKAVAVSPDGHLAAAGGKG